MGPVSSEQGAESRTGLKKQPLDLELPVVAMGARPGDNSEKRELFSETTQTALLFENGCVIQLAAAVAIGQLIFLTNKQTGQEIVTQVLRKRSYRPTDCYVELEFTEPAPGFWGVEFPEIDVPLKLDVSEGSEAAAVAESEVTGEDTNQVVPPPDAAEMAKLRQEVEALKAQLKALVPAPAAEEAKPAEIPQEAVPKPTKISSAKIELMNPNEPKPEEEKPAEAKTGAEASAAAPSSAPEENPNYPIRMQLPKAEGTTNRTSEFAADSAAIAAAEADAHLLPRPSLDFEQFPGVAEPRPKLFSGKATRSLSGPIGVLVVIVLLLVAVGIMTYRMGWLSGLGRSESKKQSSDAHASFPSNVGGTSSGAVSAAAAETGNPDAPVAGTNADGSKSEESGAGTPAVTPVEGGKHSSIENSKPVDKRNSKHVTAGHGTAADTQPVSVEDNVMVPPKLVKAIKSLSPPEALRGYVSGKVTLDAIVDETGHVVSATALSGPHALYEKAIETVKQYEYQPATKGRKPVQAHVQVSIQFWYEP